MALRLAREEGLSAGLSIGANVIAALRLAERLKPGATIVSVMCDTGMKYFGSYRAALAAAGGGTGLRKPSPRLRWGEPGGGQCRSAPR